MSCLHPLEIHSRRGDLPWPILHRYSDAHVVMVGAVMCFHAQRLLFLHQLLQLGTLWVLLL